MAYLYFIVSVLVIISLLKITAALYCLECDHVTSLSDCHRTPCSANEECYTDELVDATSIYYQGGCRARDVCHSARSGLVGKRSTTAFTACSRCCDAPVDNTTHLPCNSKLCGIQSSLPGAKDLGLCYQCDNVHDVNSCNDFTTCQHGEVCGITMKVEPGHQGVIYSMGCRDKAKCLLVTQKIIQLAQLNGGIGKRTATVGCSVCCGDSLCNTGDCKDLAKKLYTLYGGGHLNLTTLKLK